MVKKYLDQKTRDRNLDARSDRTASRAPIRRKGDDRSKKRRQNTRECNQWLAKGQCSEGDSCSFKRDVCKNGKARGKRDRPNSPSLGPKVHQKKTSREAPARPSGKEKQPSCCSYLEGKCTKPSCDYWHPPECVKHKTNGGCKCGDNFAFLHSENSEAPSKKTKIDSNADKATLANVRSFQKFGCVSQDLESLPQPSVGPTNVRRSILKKSSKISRRAHLKLRYNTKTAEHFIKLRPKSCVEFAEHTFFSPKMEWRVSSHLDHQTRRKRIYCGFRCLHAHDEQVGIDNQKNGNSQSVSTSHDCDHGERVDGHYRGGHSTLLEDTPAVLSLGTLCEENGYSYECQEGQTPFLMASIYLASATTSCLSLFLVFLK